MDTRRQSGLWRNGMPHDPADESPVSPSTAPGPYQYYQPPAPRTNGDENVKRSFSQRTAGNTADESPTQNGISRMHSKKQRDSAFGEAQDVAAQLTAPIQHVLLPNDHSLSGQLAQSKHISSLPRRDTLEHTPLRVDPDYVPDNLRTKTWSPDPMSPQSETEPQNQSRPRQTSNASNMSESRRRGSVPDRGPLQQLETWSKEEKRAMVERAERRSRQKSLATQEEEGPLVRQDTVRSGKGKIVGDSAARTSSQRDRDRQKSRQASDDPSSTHMDGPRRFKDASEALRKETSPRLSGEQRDAQPVANESRPTQRTAATTRNAAPVASSSTARSPTKAERSHSKRHRHSGSHGSAGGITTAAATTGAATASRESAAERGKAVYERRKREMQERGPASPTSPVSPVAAGFSRGNSVKQQSRPSEEYQTMGVAKQTLQTDRIGGAGSKKDRRAARVYEHPDTLPPEAVAKPANDPVNYTVPPQTAAAQEARQQVGFGDEAQAATTPGKSGHHRFGDFLHHQRHESRSYHDPNKPLDEWRRAGVARLTAEDVDFEQSTAAAAAKSKRSSQDATWWEKDRRESSSTTRPVPDLSKYDGPYEEHANGFQPLLYLRCGPLLRYTGIRTEAAKPARHSREDSTISKEVWRGSIMIVTQDDCSDLKRTPKLRIFAQPATLHEPSSKHEDPVAGQVKLSRTGRAIYARPVHEIPEGEDLSREESNLGLFAATRTPALGPQSITGPDGRQSQHITFQDKSRIKNRDGEKAGRYREVKAARLHVEQGCTFWRFNVEVELGNTEQRIAYRINKGPAVAFWVPARGETMNTMFHSCNGFSLSVNPDDFSGPDPLWRDVLNRHQSRPFHVMIGGGDQIYNDAAIRDTDLFREWLNIKNPEAKHKAEFTQEMQDELEKFYFERYAMWFSQGLFSMANSQIPMVNIWDDHDIIDGFGSYPNHFMSTRVFTGLGAIAFKYYMLFQHQSLVAETEKEEPSWVLGHEPGPFINQVSRSVFLNLGRKVAFLGLDCRMERMRNEILSQDTYDIVFDRCRAEIAKGETKHLIVLLGVPIAYPRLNFLENILTSRAMDPVKALGRTGMLGGFINKFDGGVEILDDLDDHWTAKHHKAERNWFIQELQELAAEKSVRITILGGDVHLGAVGQFYTPKKLGVRKDRDHRYMPNVISSAIVNTPPPNMMADVLNRRNKVHHLDKETDEDMIPIFTHDVDGSRRGNRHLLPRRNYCVIREWVPGSTPPPSPKLDPTDPARAATFGNDGFDEKEGRDPRFPPGSMKRTMSLSAVPNLVRRLSGSSKRPQNPPVSMGNAPGPPSQQSLPRANSLGGPRPDFSFDSERPSFLRRPTDLSQRQGRKASTAGADTTDDHIDLQDGLDISLCMEVDQHDPSGTTVPYRLLVPALTYEGPGDLNTIKFQSHRRSLMDRLRGFRNREAPNTAAQQDGYFSDENDFRSQGGATRTPSPTKNNSAAAGLGLTMTGRGAARNSMYSNVTNNTSNTGNRVGEPVVDDGYGGEDDEFPQHSQHHHDSRHSYNKGLGGALPPIGAASSAQTPPMRSQQPPAPSVSANNNPYPQSGYRRSNGVSSSGHRRPNIDADTARNTAANRAANPIRGQAVDDGYSDVGTFSEAQSDDEFDDHGAQHGGPAGAGAEDTAARGPGGGRALRFGQVEELGPDGVASQFEQHQPQQRGGLGVGGMLRKLSLQDRRSTDGGRPVAMGAGGLGRDGSVRKKGWQIWK